MNIFTRIILITVFIWSGLIGTGNANNPGEHIVKTICINCHRIEGPPIARRDKHAPDLIWAGNKYQHAWLVTWLQNPKQRLYPLGYDYNPKRKKVHYTLTITEAKTVAQYLASLKDEKIQVGLMKPGTPTQIKKGEQLYREHACSNCHWTPANTRRGFTGAKSSTSLLKMGSRLNADWVYRFNLNPNDFVPDSGAYIPKPPLSEEDIYAMTSYMMTFK
ncbi:MAG: c-type cytochrome [Nitrospirales bacterium]